ncbi:MAG: hypothetical protein HY744_23720 [Deltaproteobacteria bacterium]|nr:hypothetical protein [Deltaproteobacteria bacterium]
MIALSPFSYRLRRAAVGRLHCLLALLVALAPTLAACGPADDAEPGDGVEDWGVAGPFDGGEPVGKADNAGIPGPAVATNTSDTQVWIARNAWEDTDTPAARKAGPAWPEQSGLTWNQKYQRWVESMPRTAGYDTYYETFMLATPWGKSLPAPRLECAEVALFLRVTFAAWYELPFYLTAVDATGTRIYVGHFGVRTKTARYANTPRFASAYKDHSAMAPAQYQQSWPTDAKLRARRLGDDDQMDFIAPGARAGAYFDEIHLNKRAGHLTWFVLEYFGSIHLADARNTYNIKPEAVLEGDVLLERWQRKGIGHTLVVKTVNELEGGQLQAELASGSMPRRQPKWESPTGSKSYFTSAETGGEGTNYDGDEYVKLGGGIKRWRVTKNIGGYWTNTWMKADESSWICDTDYAALKVRPARFEQILGDADPAKMRDALVQMIEDKRNHLREYPASCSARSGREEAFDKLYDVMQSHFDMSREEVDRQYRTIEDYVFAELEYTKSKTCCWNSTTAAMYKIVMDYNNSLQQGACKSPIAFKWDHGYEVFKQYASQSGQGYLWKDWSADEPCAQQNVTVDTEVPSDATPWCSLEQ